ncbi:MAG: hypothetical protein IBX45_11885, partial [Campylobacterales bacterium]|nr:hypothetical protein [Campylobacterales bacterium]
MALHLDSTYIQYQNNKVLVAKMPESGENFSVFLRPGDEVQFAVSDLDLDALEYVLVGGDIVVFFPGGGALTFASLGLMGFSGNPPKFNFGGGNIVTVDDILSKIEEVNELPIESVNASFKIRVSNVEEETGLMNSPDEAPPAPQIIIQPQFQPMAEAETKQEDFVGMYQDDARNDEEAIDTRSNVDESSSSSRAAGVGISNVSDAAQASLKFSIGFYQTDYEINRSSDPSTPTEVLGGGGSKLGNVSTAPVAQIEPHTIDMREEYKEAVIYADNPAQFGANGEFITRVVRITPEQPEGFGVTLVEISGLKPGFEIIGASGVGAYQSLVQAVDGVPDGFTIVTTDSGTAIEFLIRYPSNTPVSTHAINVKITSNFNLANVEEGRAIEVPDLQMLIEENDVNLQVKQTLTASDYVYQSQAGEQGFILNSNLNRNIIYTSQGNSTVYGGVASDTIFGQRGNDTLFGGAGNDTLSGGAGVNIMDGGAGSDTIDYAFVDRFTAFEGIEARDMLTSDQFQEIITLLNTGVNINLADGTATGRTADREYFEAILQTTPEGGMADYARLMPTFTDTFT